MIPDLPIPVTITRPRQRRSNSTASLNLPSRRRTSARIAAASVSSTLRASARSAMDAFRRVRGDPAALHDRIDRFQLPQQRLEQLEPERVLRVAFRAHRLLVHLDENTVDAR